jgi:hypothetical protein
MPAHIIVDKIPTATAWWYAPVLAGAITLFGVLIAQGVTLRVQRSLSHRRDQERWDRELIAAATDFASACMRILHETQRDLLQDDAVDTLRFALEDRYTRLELVAPASLVELAQDCWATGVALLMSGDWKRYGSMLNEKRTAFVEGVRLRLGAPALYIATEEDVIRSRLKT